MSELPFLKVTQIKRQDFQQMIWFSIANSAIHTAHKQDCYSSVTPVSSGLLLICKKTPKPKPKTHIKILYKNAIQTNLFPPLCSNLDLKTEMLCYDTSTQLLFHILQSPDSESLMSNNNSPYGNHSFGWKINKWINCYSLHGPSSSPCITQHVIGQCSVWVDHQVELSCNQNVTHIKDDSCKFVSITRLDFP